MDKKNWKTSSFHTDNLREWESARTRCMVPYKFFILEQGVHLIGWCLIGEILRYYGVRHKGVAYHFLSFRLGTVGRASVCTLHIQPQSPDSDAADNDHLKVWWS